MSETTPQPDTCPEDAAPAADVAGGASTPVNPRLPDPTRYGDWEKNGRCIDF